MNAGRILRQLNHETKLEKHLANKIKPDTFISKDPELTRETNKLILSYFYLVSKLMRNNKKKVRKKTYP